MRIVTWNCCGAFAAKYPWLRDLGFDVAVLQECVPLADDPSLSQVLRPARAGGGKQFGAIARAPWAVEPLTVPAAEPMPWLLPIRITGPVDFTLLSVWAQTPPPAYTVQLRRVVAEVLPALDGPVVLAGDLNAPGHGGTASLRSFLRTVELLDAAGLVSAFGAARGWSPSQLYTADGGVAPALREATYFHHRRLDGPWHLDHVFVPKEWASGIRTTVGSHEEWVASGRSDHVPVAVELSVRPAEDGPSGY